MLNKTEVFSQEEVQYFLNQSFSIDTSVDNRFWTPDNPSFGHCAVASAVAQDYRGGIMLELHFPFWFIKEMGCIHHVLMVNGQVEDYTKQQFPERFPYKEWIDNELCRVDTKEDVRESVLYYREFNRCYLLLKERFDQNLRSAKRQGMRIDLLDQYDRLA